MTRQHRRMMTAAVLGLSMLAAACGSSGGGGTASGGTTGTTAGASGGNTKDTVDPGVQAGIKDALGGASTTAAASTGTTATATTVPAGPPQSMDDWNKLWTTQRAAIVKRITDNKWGLSADGKTITGAEGFTIDVSKCPAGWNNIEGITDTELKLGHTIAQSGTLAIYGQIANGMKAYFDVVNKTGIKDSTGKTRKITYIPKDDGYDAARTIPLVDELLDSEKVFTLITLGSPNTMKTYDKLNQRCVPQPIVMTGHPAWGDPVNHPWTTGQQLAYNTEAVVWGSIIEQKAAELKGSDGKITVSALVMNNDFGKAYIAGFKAWLAQTPIASQVNLQTETIEPTAPTITDPMTTLASKNPSVFIAMTAGTSCTQAITEASQNGLKEKAKMLFQPSVCVGNSFLGKDKVGGDGSASNGWFIVNGAAKTLESAAFDNDPWAKYARDQLTAAGIDWKKENTTLTGTNWAWDYEQIVQIASALNGGLTRANFMVALRAMDMTNPALVDGAKWNMNGNKDAYLTEAAQLVQYDSAKQVVTPVGPVIELSGKSTNCVWDQQAGTCK